MPGAPGETVDSISNSATNHAGGFAFTTNSTGSGTTLSHVWGHATGGPGAPLRTEGTFGDYQQTAFESFFGIADAGQAGYGPTTNHLPSGLTGLDAVWVDSTPILTERDPVSSLPGMFSTFNSRPGVTATGEPYWVGGIANTLGGATQNRVLFYGAGLTPVLMGGDTVTGVAEPISTGSSGIDFDYRFSALGTYNIVPVVVTSTSATDTVLVSNGAALAPGGGIMREGSPVPASIGGLPGENYGTFDFVGISETGNFFATGETSAAVTLDEFVMTGGQIVLREGAMLGTSTISGAIEGGYMNEDGDWAVAWDVTPSGGTNIEALIFNGSIVLQEGDPVDWNGDGVIDPLDNNGVLADFTGITALTIGDRDPSSGLVDIYFTADIDFNGTSSTTDDLEGGFRLRVPEPGALSLLLIGGLVLIQRRSR